MAEPVNIGGKIPGSGMSRDQFESLANRMIEAVSGKKGNGSTGGDANITINQTVNNNINNNTGGSDNPFDRLGWQFARASWLGDDSAEKGNTEEAFRTLAGEIEKLSSSMQGLQKSAESFLKVDTIKRNLENGYNGDSVADYIESVRSLNEITENPKAVIEKLTSSLADLDERFDKVGGRNYTDHNGRGFIPSARLFETTSKYAKDIIGEAQVALNGGDVTTAMRALIAAKTYADKVPRALQDVVSDIERREALEKKAALKRGNQDYISDVTNDERHAINREKQNTAVQNQTSNAVNEAKRQTAEAEKQAAEAKKRAEEVQRNADEQREQFRKEVADIEKSTAEAQKRFAESQRAQAKDQTGGNGNNAVNGGTPLAGPGGGNGGTPTSGSGGGNSGVPSSGLNGGNVTPQNGVIRYFKSLTELTDYLNNLNTGELSSVSGEIKGILESLNGLDPEAKNITALFDNDGMLRSIGLTGVSKKYGSAEIASMHYGFGMKRVDPDDEDSPWFYTVNRAQTRTTTYTDKIEKYQADLEAREQALVTKLTAMHNLPIMQGDSSSNSLLKQWEEIARISPNGVELINKGSLSDVENAEERLKSLQESIKAINNLITKKWANNSIEKMTENVEDMESLRKTLPNAFSKMGISSENLFGDFDIAAEKFHKAVDPREQALAYNEMAKAMRNVKRVLTEENSVYRENVRLTQQKNKMDRSSKVVLSRYKERYDQMGDGRPDQYTQARDAAKRYKNAKNASERESAYKDYQENMSWMRDDLDVRYPKFKEREKRNAAMGKQNRRQYRVVTNQNVQAEKISKELADLAQPYGGLESGSLPDYLQKTLKALQEFKNEGNLEKRISKLTNVKSLLANAKTQNERAVNLDQANTLIGQMDSSSQMMTAPINNLQSAIDQVNGLTKTSTANEIADAYANLAARLREATDAQKAYEKAAADAEKSQNAIDKTVSTKWSQYENFTKQLESIKLAYEKMGTIAPTGPVDGLMDQLFNADVMDPKAIKDVTDELKIAMKQLGERRTFDKAVFDATNKRDSKTNSLNDWINGLNVDDRNLQKIQELRAALQSLNAIDLRAPNQLAAFNTQLADVNKIADDAKELVDIRQRYRDVISDKNYGLLGGEHGAANRTISQQMKTDLENAYAAFVANPDDVAIVQALADALQVVEERLGNISQIDAFGKLNEKAQKLEQSMNFLTSKHGATNTWKPAQQAVVSSYTNLMGQYNAQVSAGNLSGATESMTQLNNQVTALNQSFKSGSGLVGVYDGKLSGLVTRILGVGSGFMAVNKVINTYKKMAGYVTRIDTAMTELKKVTDESAAAYNRFQKQSGQTAINIGSSITDLINTSVEYGRMGYNLAESQQLGVVTTKFANTGNFNSVTDASDALIAIIRGFDELDIGDAEKVSDKLTAVANAYAVTASDIAAGLQRSASALNLGGVNVDQATAMITAISEVTRDSSAAGNAIKTMSMRIRGAKTE